MKINRVLTVCGLAAALFLSAGSLMAQDDGGGNGGGGRRGGFGGGGNGFGGGRFDPAEMQQRMMDNIKEELGFTNETEWTAVQPLIQKVMDARRDAGGMGGMGRMFRNRGGNGDNGGRGPGRGGFFGTPSPEAESLQKAIDDNAPTAQIKSALEKYETSQKDKRAKLTAAQSDLRKVLTVKQEAQATLLGLLE